MSLRTTTAVCGLASAIAPIVALAHAFDERHELPVPLGFFVAGAATTVALSFVVTAVVARQAPVDDTQASQPRFMSFSLGPLLPVLRRILPSLSVLLLVIVVASALWGTGNPMMNLAPTFVWVAWWVGGSLAVACIGNFWPVLDPWRGIYQFIDMLLRALGRAQGASLGLSWPRALDAWPAVALLLLWSACEVVFPLAAVPFRVGVAAILWSLVTLGGMVCFGRKTWQQYGDVFAIYFTTLGRFAPLARGTNEKSLLVRPFGSSLVSTDAASMAMVAFIVAMLASVLFDGLLAGEGWSMLEPALRGRYPQLMDADGYFAGSAGLILVWTVFLFAYLAACAMTGAILGNAAASFSTARACAPTLVPIAVAYGIAHNFSGLLLQGQNLIPLVSDPLGAGWNLFGTAGFRPNIAIIDAGTTWHVAIGAIVVGHVMAVWLAHQVALRRCKDPLKAALASIPLTILMVAYTAISLLVIAEPMVKFA